MQYQRLRVAEGVRINRRPDMAVPVGEMGRRVRIVGIVVVLGFGVAGRVCEPGVLLAAGKEIRFPCQIRSAGAVLESHRYIEGEGEVRRLRTGVLEALRVIGIIVSEVPIVRQRRNLRCQRGRRAAALRNHSVPPIVPVRNRAVSCICGSGSERCCDITPTVSGVVVGSARVHRRIVRTGSDKEKHASSRYNVNYYHLYWKAVTLP